ncbi:MAG: hypothetical protein H6710_12120 [Myxococcales bacterium]|nr:hypothetical protein [Myxococcales bacterium]
MASLFAGCVGGDDTGGTESESGAMSMTATATTTTTAMTTSTTTTTTTPSETESESGGGIAGCECIVDDMDVELSAPSLPTCGAALCDVVDVRCASEGSTELASCRQGFATLTVNNPDALTCALEALRDREAGILRWDSNKNDQFQDHGYLLIAADGRAVGRAWHYYDLGYGVGDATLAELDPVATFEGCLASADLSERFFCLVDALAEPAIAVCDEGWMGGVA